MDLTSSCSHKLRTDECSNAHAHQPGGRSVPSAYLDPPSFLSLPFPRHPLSCGQSRRWFRFARTNPVIRTDQTGFACRFPMSRREFDRFLPYPDRRRSPAGAIAERCMRAWPSGSRTHVLRDGQDTRADRKHWYASPSVSDNEQLSVC